MKLVRSILSIVFTCFSLLSLKAQDVHFSQFYQTPINFNPANTGLFSGLYRLGANYRTQWNSVTVPYNTYSIWGDISFLQPKSPVRKRKKDVGQFGLGAILINDVAGDGKLRTTKIGLSGAIHQSLNFDNSVYASAGISAYLVQKRIDFSKLYFGNQWDDHNFDLTVDNLENANGNLNYLDFNFGGDINALLQKKYMMHGGLSFIHWNKPNESFYSPELTTQLGNIFEYKNRLGLRPVLNVGGNFQMTKEITLWPEVIWMFQKKAREFILGLNAGYNISNTARVRKILYAGLTLRLNDAVTPVIGFERNNVRTMMSYDVNLSTLKVASKGRGGLELSIIYIGDNGYSKSVGRANFIKVCPRF